jgi:5'-nucleotidase
MIRRFALAATVAVATAILLSAFNALWMPTTAQTETVSVQLLAFNDFHGHLEPPSGSDGRIGSTQAGGVEYLATHLARLKAGNANTLVVSAGDNIGASPLLSGLFHDEPTIEALSAAGLQVSAVGNHEFDEGWTELYRMQKGGCHPTDGCQDGTPFTGARFEYLSANVLLDPRKTSKALLDKIGWKTTDNRPRPLLPAYAIKEVGSVKLGFIGMTLKGTPQIVVPTGVQALSFQAEADTANNLIPLLKKNGVHAIVVLLHEGGVPTGGNYNGCESVSGPILQIANRMSNDVDVIVSGHTHRAYVCTIGTKLVTSAASYGRLITDIDLRIDKVTDEIVSKTARNVIVTHEVPKNPAQSAILDRYRPFYTAIAHKVIGSIGSDITRRQNAAGESALGDLIADAQMEATKDLSKGGAVVAFTNSGGIRADLVYAQQTAGEQPGAVTYTEAFSVQPFGNRVIVKTMTGEMIRRALEQQFDNPAPGRNILQVSNGFTYEYDPARPRGRRVDPASIKIDGQTVVGSRAYRVAINEFLSAGGGGFAMFTAGTNPVDAGVDVDALVEYLDKHSPVTLGTQNRIRRTISTSRQ